MSESAKSTASSTISNDAAANSLGSLARNPSTVITIGSDGKIVLRDYDGQGHTVPNSELLTDGLGITTGDLAALLDKNRPLLADLIKLANSAGDSAQQLSELRSQIELFDLTPGGSDASDDIPAGSNELDGRAAAPVNSGLTPQDSSATLGTPITPNIERVQETVQFGSDDLKRGEAGSKGQIIDTGVGSPLEHLIGLADEEPGIRNGEKDRHSDNVVFSGEATGVGTGIDHLWLLGDTEYYRTVELPDRYASDPIARTDDDRSQPQIIPFTRGQTEFAGTEDTDVTGQIVTPTDPRLPIDDFRTPLPPSVGAIDFRPDGSFTFTPAPHVSGVVTIPFVFTDGVTRTPTTGELTIEVGAVADAPVVSGAAVGPEDTDIALSIDISLVDADGSETVDSVVITGVPSGALVTWPPALNGVITQNPSGTITIDGTPAEIQAAIDAIRLTPPLDFSGDIPLQVTATTIESNSNPGLPGHNDTATTTVPFIVTVQPVPDLPIVAGQSTVDEDTTVNFGGDIAIVPLDATDGSERITEITLGGIPASATVTYTPHGGATVTPVTANGVTTYTISGGTEADIRATLADFSLQPALHSDENISVSVDITKIDNGVVGTTTGTHDILVAAVADAPLVSGSASGLEDQAIALPITVDLVDDDGSESYDFADVVVPTGVTLTFDTPPAGITVTPIANGFRFTPSPGTPPATFEAFLATALDVTPPADSDIDFDVSVNVGTIERVLSGGEVSLVTTSTPATIPVTVTPVVDEPSISGDSGVDEDGSVTFGSDITITQGDATDGSQAISEITVGNLPAGLVPSYTAQGTASVAVVGGIFVISGSDTDDILATLATFGIDASDPAYADLDGDLNLAITVTTTDTDDVTGIAVSETTDHTHTIIVNAVADAPTVSGATETTPEDTAVHLSTLAAALNDIDGSEALTVQITGVDPDAVLQSGTSTPYPFTVATD
ncbi:MAG: hypothetical protein AAFY64_00920, partial [Pseudomonadota bacterium]